MRRAGHPSASRGSVLGDESRFDALRGGPRTGGAYDARHRRRARRADGRPRVLDALRRPGAGRRARARPRAARRRRAGPRAHRRRRGARPERAPSPRSRSPPMSELIAHDQRAVGQLLRRDAAQGPRRALRRRRHDRGRRGGRAAASSPRSASRPPIVDGSGLSRANRTTPREVVRPARAHARGRATPRRSRPRCRSPGARHAAPPDARHRRRQALPRQDGTLNRVSALAGLCVTRQGHTVAFAFLMNGVAIWRAHGAQDRALRALVSYRARPEPACRRRAGEPQLSPSSSASSPASSSTATPRRSAFSSFEPGALAGDDVVGLLRDRRGHAPAGGEDPLGRLLAREVGQRAGQHERPAGQRALAGRRALLLELQARRRAGRRSARASPASASCSWISAATIGPMPGVSRDLLGRRGEQRVDRCGSAGPGCAR